MDSVVTNELIKEIIEKIGSTGYLVSWVEFSKFSVIKDGNHLFDVNLVLKGYLNKRNQAVYKLKPELFFPNSGGPIDVFAEVIYIINNRMNTNQIELIDTIQYMYSVNNWPID